MTDRDSPAPTDSEQSEGQSAEHESAGEEGDETDCVRDNPVPCRHR